MGFTATPKPTKAILCMHGGGSSGDIFRFQTSSVRLALQHEYDFVYASGPHIATPGPGVLPFFAGMDPFFSWFRTNYESLDEEVAIFNEAVKKRIETYHRENPGVIIIGILGFSQGAVATTMLLWQQQVGMIPWLPKLEFGILFCPGFSADATGYMREVCRREDLDEAALLIKPPTIHFHGRQDVVNLPQSRKMYTTCYSSVNATLEEFDGEHEVPRKAADVKKILSYLHELTSCC